MIITRNKIFITLLFIFSLILPAQLMAHTYNVPVIIDTDMGLDDARAIVMLMNQGTFDVLLTVTSDGAVSPETGNKNVRTLYSILNKNQIPVVSGKELSKTAPPWREWTKDIFAFHKGNIPQTSAPYANASSAIVQILNKRKRRAIYLCLGPLTNLADALEKDAGIKQKISRVIYYGTAPGDKEPDWNSSRDVEAMKKVFQSGLKIYTLRSNAVKPSVFGPQLFKKIEAQNTAASQLIVKLHHNPTASRLLSQEHFRIWDETTVIYISQPGLFRFTPQGRNIFLLKSMDASKIQSIYVRMLARSTHSHSHSHSHSHNQIEARKVVLLNHFPDSPELFKPDVAPSVKKIITTHGMEEWKACVLTNELHRHLGIYSIIGAKMGIRAREILQAPLDSLDVTSYAGLQPPLSCLNDGLQVSTGASLGRGNITVKETGTGPAAQFSYKDKQVTLKLKDAVVQQIKKDIRTAIQEYGNLTPQYFQQIRKLSVQYWFKLDRNKIFEKQ